MFKTFDYLEQVSETKTCPLCGNKVNLLKSLVGKYLRCEVGKCRYLLPITEEESIKYKDILGGYVNVR